MTTTTRSKKLLGAAAFSLALAGGGAVGAVLGAPGVSGAQETPAVDQDGDVDAAPTPAHRHPGPRGAALDTAAEALGLTAEELHAELDAGASIADVAAERGIDVQTVIDALVAEATAEMTERITAFVHGELPPPHAHGFGRGLDAAAEALGMTAAELREALSVEGTSLADVAAAEGIDVQDVIDALVTEAEAHLDEAVAAGRLTQAEADEKKADLEARITERVNSDQPLAGHGRGGVGRRGGHR